MFAILQNIIPSDTPSVIIDSLLNRFTFICTKCLYKNHHIVFDSKIKTRVLLKPLSFIPEDIPHIIPYEVFTDLNIQLQKYNERIGPLEKFDNIYQMYNYIIQYRSILDKYPNYYIMVEWDHDLHKLYADQMYIEDVKKRSSLDMFNLSRLINIMDIAYEDLHMYITLHKINRKKIRGKEIHEILYKKIEKCPNFRTYWRELSNYKNKISPVHHFIDSSATPENIFNIIKNNILPLCLVVHPRYFLSGDIYSLYESVIDMDCIVTGEIMDSLFIRKDLPTITFQDEIDMDHLMYTFDQFQYVRISIESIPGIMQGLHVFTVLCLENQTYLIQSYADKYSFRYRSYDSFETILYVIRDIYVKRDAKSLYNLFHVEPEITTYTFPSHISFVFSHVRIPSINEIQNMIKYGECLKTIGH